MQFLLDIAITAGITVLSLLTVGRLVGVAQAVGIALGTGRRSAVRVPVWFVPLRLAVAAGFCWAFAEVLVRDGRLDLAEAGVTQFRLVVSGVWLWIVVGLVGLLVLLGCVGGFAVARGMPKLAPGRRRVTIHPAVFALHLVYVRHRRPGRWLVTEAQALAYTVLLGLSRSAAEEIDEQLADLDDDDWLSWRSAAVWVAREATAEVSGGVEDGLSEARREQGPAADPKRSDRRRADVAAFILGVALVLTVLTPWLIGKFAKGTFLLPYSDAVSNAEGRDGLDYFAVELGFGACAIALAVAAFLVLRPWGGRPVGVTLGLGLAVATVVALLPLVLDDMRAHEDAAARRLANGIAEAVTAKLDTCFVSEVPYDEDEYAKYGGQIAGIRGPGGSCGTLVAFTGWRELGRAILPSGHQVDGNPTPVGGYLPDQGTFERNAVWVAMVAKPDGQRYLTGFVLATPGQRWSYEDAAIRKGATQLEFVYPTAVVAVEGKDQLVGVDARTGKRVWRVTCPRGTTFAGLQPSNWAGTVLGCAGDNGTRLFNVDGSGKLSER